MSDLSDLVHIEDPEWYLNDPYPLYERLRREEPVFYYEPLDCFVLTRYDDVKYVTRTPETFSNAHGMFLPDIRLMSTIVSDEGTGSVLFPPKGEQIGFTDPPRHRELRKVISPAFTGRVMSSMENDILGYSHDIVDSIKKGAVTDWVPLASLLPVRLAALLLGLPDDNVDQLRFWSDALERAISVQDADELKAAGEDFAPIYDYIRSFFQEKQASSSDDLIATLLRAELDNERLSEDNILMFAVTMLAAGNDTTRSLLSGLVLTLAEHPEELAKVVADRSLIAGTVEECMRWITPARGFVRWVRHDTEIRGHKLRQGQYVYILYAAANRDEEVFEHAETFDVARKENAMQLAFGFGTHVCIGAPLVRLEAKALLGTLLDTFEHFELAGAPSRVLGSALREGWTHAPVIFS